MEDRKIIHKKFVKLGRERNRVTYKLLALLPTICKQRIYAIEGYATIHEYAGKLAGLSPGVVDKTLRIGKYLENKPELQKKIETEGIHKVAIVARLATPDTDFDFADKVSNMSKNSLQDLSRELRRKRMIRNLNGGMNWEFRNADCDLSPQSELWNLNGNLRETLDEAYGFNLTGVELCGAERVKKKISI